MKIIRLNYICALDKIKVNLHKIISFYLDEDLLEQLTQEYNEQSWLDVSNASPSEILADAGLVPVISPIQSVKSSSNESSNSDSGSDDDSKK